MKLKQWLYGAAALAMLAACSDHDVVPSGGGSDEGGDGYIGIKIQLPTTSATRANDDFDDGESSEYEVKDAVLLLFQGADQATAEFTGAFTLQDSEPEGFEDNPNQITSILTRVASVSGIKSETTNKIYALVMVNGAANGLYTKEEPQASWMLDIENKTIKGFQEYVTNEALFYQATPGDGYASGILMINSPLSVKPGGDDDPGTIKDALPVLVELDKKIYATEREARENSAGVIHVERAVGKVTCSEFNKATNLTVKVGGYDYKLTVDKIWWDMAQDLANTYLVRNTNRTPTVASLGTENMWAWNLKTSNKDASGNDIQKPYRMIGHESLAVTKGDVTTKYYRPYFCQVPGYGVAFDGYKIKEKKSFTKEKMEFSDKSVEWSANSAFYPRENTFPVEFMKYANTTRIGFWVTFKFESTDVGAPAIDGSKNLYISGADKTTFYVDDAAGLNPLQNEVLAELSSETKYKDLKDAIVKAVRTDQQGTFKMDNLLELINIVCDEDKDGKIKVKSISFKSLSEINNSDHYHDAFQSAPTYNFSTHLAALNNLGQYYRYDGGKVFYEVRIKHFGDTQTPWALEKDLTKPATTIDESYGDSKRANYLGRYGIVRNNWYDIVVDEVTKIGYPRDPAIWEDAWPGKPDDNRDQFIAVELRVLSWAKRTQHTTF